MNMLCGLTFYRDQSHYVSLLLLKIRTKGSTLHLSLIVFSPIKTKCTPSAVAYYFFSKLELYHQCANCCKNCVFKGSDVHLSVFIRAHEFHEAQVLPVRK